MSESFTISLLCPHCHESTILTAPAVAHNDRLLYVGEYPTGILSTCDRCLSEYPLVLQVNEAKTPAGFFKSRKIVGATHFGRQWADI